MTSALGGLKPLAPVSGISDTTPELTAEEQQGGPANPAHAQPLAGPLRYPWESFPNETHGPYGLENGLLGVDIVAYETPAGTLASDPTGDLQPNTHAAPYPKDIPQSVGPDAVTGQVLESRDIHASNMGQSRRIQNSSNGYAENNQWIGNDTAEVGSTLQVPIPQQVQTGAGGFLSTDRVQSMAEQNQYGFDTAHTRQRYAVAPIPGNYQMMIPGQRPLVMTQQGVGVIPNATDSPFIGQVIGEPYDTQGSVLTVLPASYVPSPSPQVAPDYSTVQAESQVSLW